VGRTATTERRQGGRPWRRWTGTVEDAQRSLPEPRVSPFLGDEFERSSPRDADAPPWLKKADPDATDQPARKPSGETRPVFKTVARAATLPTLKPVPKKARKRRGDSRSFRTKDIVDDYLGLCRKPFSDLQRWMEEFDNIPFSSNAHQQAPHDRQAPIVPTRQLSGDALHEVSRRFPSNDDRRPDNAPVSGQSTAGPSEARALQQVRGSRSLADFRDCAGWCLDTPASYRRPQARDGPEECSSAAPRAGDGGGNSGGATPAEDRRISTGDGDIILPFIDGSELAGLHAFYGALIAAARFNLPPDEAAAAVSRLRIQKTLDVRKVNDQLRAARANRPKPQKPERPTSLPRPPPRQARHP